MRSFNVAMRLPWLCVFMAVAPMACTAKVGAEDLRVPEDAARTCASQCHAIGLSLAAVAIMAETVGCVCQAAPLPPVGPPVPGQPPPSGPAMQGASISAGMATIAMQEEQRRQQQQRQAHPTVP